MTTDQEPTAQEAAEQPITCPACGAVAVHKGDMLVTEHELDCAWLLNPESPRYDTPEDDETIFIPLEQHAHEFNVPDDIPRATVEPLALEDLANILAAGDAGDRGEQGAGLPHEAPLLPPPSTDDLIPRMGSLRERPIAEVEQDAIDEHIRMARELLEGSANNMSERSVQLSLAHSAAAQVMMTRWLMGGPT